MPRLGRRESEPHSAALTYLHQVLQANFPDDRAMWDLHHYFDVAGEGLKTREIDVQFDVSYFRDFKLSEELPSYKAREFQGRIPDVAVNVLSRSTWRKDLLDIAVKCQQIQVPAYVVFFAYPIVPTLFPLPYLRAYLRQPDGSYVERELKKTTYDGEELVDPEAVVDLGDRAPFRVGLQRRETKFKGGKDTYWAVLMHRDAPTRYLSKAQATKRRADEEKRRADEEKRRADEEKRRADEATQRVDHLERELARLRKTGKSE